MRGKCIWVVCFSEQLCPVFGLYHEGKLPFWLQPRRCLSRGGCLSTEPWSLTAAQGPAAPLPSTSPWWGILEQQLPAPPSVNFWISRGFLSTCLNVKYVKKPYKQEISPNQQRKSTIHSSPKFSRLCKGRVCCLPGKCKLFFIIGLNSILSFPLLNVAVIVLY